MFNLYANVSEYTIHDISIKFSTDFHNLFMTKKKTCHVNSTHVHSFVRSPFSRNVENVQESDFYLLSFIYELTTYITNVCVDDRRCVCGAVRVYVIDISS